MASADRLGYSLRPRCLRERSSAPIQRDRSENTTTDFINGAPAWYISMTTIVLIFGGLIALAVGGELLVRGAVQLAERIGVSALLISLTLVGFGTSTPEIVTSVQAALIGSPGIAIGNIVGSNIANILLILGVSALIKPIAVSSLALRRDGVLVAIAAALFAAVSWLWTLDRTVGLILIAGLMAYVVYAVRQESTGADGRTAAFERAEAFEAIHAGTHLHSIQSAKARKTSLMLSLGSALAGLVLVVVGGRFLVDGAIGLAHLLEISESVSSGSRSSPSELQRPR